MIGYDSQRCPAALRRTKRHGSTRIKLVVRSSAIAALALIVCIPTGFVAAPVSWRQPARGACGGQLGELERRRHRGLETSQPAVATAVEDTTPILVAEKRKSRRGGGGGGPSPQDQAQVVVYRLALILTALSWGACYTLDFFMTSGVALIDGSWQAAALRSADVFAAVAALAAPMGSTVLAEACLRLAGGATLLAAAIGLNAPGLVASVAGPICIVLVAAREIYWFGLSFKGDAAAAVAAYSIIAALRLASALDETRAAAPVAAELAAMEEVQPIGPPVALSFGASLSLNVMSFGKLFEPLGEDLDEEGEQWAKASSRSLYDYEPPPQEESKSKSDGD
eukprot:TRINITY_DN16264_c0_g1_i1.p1 TRINITY_DN16264_c0_g1~~TRINITY_DN16264_c0_g1_i1.p1  ORF type:complete len:338 (-),score=71.97 TRINITY_DN16264_c0_g1_i1:28-1041(-)